MIFALLAVGTLAGILSALFAVIVLGTPVWAGIALWSVLGSAVLLGGTALASLRSADIGASPHRRAIA